MDEVMELLLLEQTLDGIELTEEDSRFLRWICGWDHWTAEQFRQIIGKCRGMGGDCHKRELILNLPAAVGATVWDIHFPECPFTVIGYRIGRMIWEDPDGLAFSKHELLMHYECDGIATCAAVSSIGKTVFLTSEELKAALKE